MRKLRCLITAAFVCLSLYSEGQFYYFNDKYFDSDFVFEVGPSFGLMNCITDLGGQRSKQKRYFNEINWSNSNAAIGGYIALSYRDAIVARIEATWGKVDANDSIVKPFSSRYIRNLSFRSDIREVAAVFELHPLFLKSYEENPPLLSPYVAFGAGWYHFNPQANLDGQWVDLQPLHTEGQGFKEYPDRQPYRLAQLNLCMGAGIRYELTPMFHIRLEWLHRYLFTDYLDDASTRYIDPTLFAKYLNPTQAQQARQLNKRTTVRTSQRGDPKNNDAYFTINFKVGMTLGRTKR